MEAWDHILSGSSLKMLVQYRSVCKAWLWIIDYLYPWNKDLNPEETSTFGCSNGDDTTGPRIYAITRMGDEMKQIQIASFPELRGFRHEVSNKVSTCNGLVIFEKRDDGDSRIEESAVVNPLTKEIFRVPGSPYLPVLFDNLTLGFDPLSGIHKLVQLLVRSVRNNLGAAVYDLRDRRWRFRRMPSRLLKSADGAFDNEDQERSGGFCVFGTLYWVLYRQRRKKIMVSFKLGNEEFGLPPMPLYFEKYERTVLTNVGGCLAVCNLSFGHSIEVCILEGVKSKKDWNKRLVIYLDGPIHSTDDVIGVYSHGDRILLRGRGSSEKEGWFVMQDVEDMLFKSCIKDGLSYGVDVYCQPAWNTLSLI